MKRVAVGIALAFAWLAAGGVGMGQEKAAGAAQPRPNPQTAEWQQLRSLAGEWAGTAEEAGKKMPAQLEVRVTGDGSALMHVMDKGGRYEMVTMFHADGERLLATHYCAAHNQPRMALTKAPAANQLVFEFVDGTNIRPGDAHMARVALTFIDPDHHDEAWTSRVNGTDGPPMVFHYTRKK